MISKTKPQIIAIANQKGGVGKTTSTINLAAALGEIGHRVLIVDMDPQGNASTGLGIDSTDRSKSIANILYDGVNLIQNKRGTTTPNVDIVASSGDLASADMELKDVSGRSRLLKNALSLGDLEEAGINYVLIDCPPTLGLLTINALVAAHSVLIPLQAEFFALEGLTQLMQTIRGLRDSGNPSLSIEGILLTMVDRRNNLSVQVESEVREVMGDLVFETVIPRNVRVSEAPSHAQAVLHYDTQSRGAAAYRSLAQEMTGSVLGKKAG